MYALATIDRRRGVTLTEVLVAIFIMAIGLMALLTLFPLGALNMAQAIKDDRCGTGGYNSAAVAQAAWRILYESQGGGDPDPNMTPMLLNAGQLYWPNLPDFSTAPQPAGPGYPLFVDPFGYNGLYGPNPGPTVTPLSWHTWLAGQAGTAAGAGVATGIPRYSAAQPVPGPNAPLTNWTSTFGFFSNNDDLTYDENGVPPNGLVERRRQYSYAWLVRRVSSLDATQLNLTVVVYSGRALQSTPDVAAQGETAYAATFGTNGPNTVTITPGAGQDKPAVRRGSWILDATVTATLGNGAQGGYFYRVVDITELGNNSLLLELQTPYQAPSGPGVTSTVIVLDNVAEVFQKAPIAAKY
jgi:prepilin-type N-terminal cleavage/methylation domain-containing protein